MSRALWVRRAGSHLRAERGDKFKTMSTYSDKLQDPRWQKKRLLIMERDGFACRQCGATDRTLHVHHTYYVPTPKGAPREDPWEYPDHMLVTLCSFCHENEEECKLGYDGYLTQTIRALGATNLQIDGLVGQMDTITNLVGSAAALAVIREALNEMEAELAARKSAP